MGREYRQTHLQGMLLPTILRVNYAKEVAGMAREQYFNYLFVLSVSLSVTGCTTIDQSLEGLETLCAQSSLKVTTDRVYGTRHDLCEPETGDCTSLAQALTTATLCESDQPVLLLANATYLMDRPMPMHPSIRRRQVNSENEFGATGLPVVANNIIIEGNGASIRREVDESPELGALANPFRFFHVMDGGFLSIRDLTLENGLFYKVIPSAGEDIRQLGGGAIFNQGTLRLFNTHFVGNSTRRPPSHHPEPGLQYVTFRGAALFNLGDLRMVGGRIDKSFAAGPLRSGVWNERLATFDYVLFEGSVSPYAIIVNAGGEMRITRSSVHATNLIDNYSGDLDISQSQSDGFVTGAGGSVTITNSTLGGAGHEGVICGPADSSGSPTLYMENVTIARARVSPRFPESTGFGLVVRATCSAEVKNSVIAENGRQDCVVYAGGSLISSGVNMDSDNSCTGFITVSPRIGELRDNGGPTRTYMPLSGSPLIDAGGTSCPPIDQRGFPRDDGACDVGATER
ncbi:choice-of-anchor Q domain-containing protein [Alteromonas sp. ASW11-130]|uniref:choice-of-anchor Q domain-containing protein n=1 Tax=Alteromonas sp. ASW11-130 TaxID=3015775 RepID=UPI00224211F6|nr:choice-of-anchor Q domain-containing protein [Alteromonas sp. ASW11-130]MCW8092723.1 hypothetical protein [Alteromonas sp. ASW11-130]